MPTSDWSPSVQDVGDQLRARTKDDTGTEVGTFTDKTRPTADQVKRVINQAVSQVAMRVGTELPTPTWVDAKAVAALRAAMLVELQYFPEQINGNRSPYPQLKVLFDEAIFQLLLAITAAGGDPGESGAPMKPVASFPMTGDPYIIGRRTAW